MTLAAPLVGVKALQMGGGEVWNKRSIVNDSLIAIDGSTHLCQAKVAESAFARTRVVKKVGRLDVTMNNIVRVRAVQCTEKTAKVAAEIAERHDTIVLLWEESVRHKSECGSAKEVGLFHGGRRPTRKSACLLYGITAMIWSSVRNAVIKYATLRQPRKSSMSSSSLIIR